MRLERETSQAAAKAQVRTNTIATRFDRLCGVLESLGYLEPADAGEPAGEGNSP